MPPPVCYAAVMQPLAWIKRHPRIVAVLALVVVAPMGALVGPRPDSPSDFEAVNPREEFDAIIAKMKAQNAAAQRRMDQLNEQSWQERRKREGLSDVDGK